MGSAGQWMVLIASLQPSSIHPVSEKRRYDLVVFGLDRLLYATRTVLLRDDLERAVQRLKRGRKELGAVAVIVIISYPFSWM